MKEIALHLLDLAENSIAAEAGHVIIQVREDLNADRLTASVQDNGRGMDPETVRKVIDPFFTSRTTRKVGLGIPLLKEAAEACNGFLSIQSNPGTGTRVEVEFQHSHIDRMPLGNLSTTFLELLAMHPETHWLFTYTACNGAGESTFTFDDRPVKEILAGMPLTHPEVLTFLRETLEAGLTETQAALQPI